MYSFVLNFCIPNISFYIFSIFFHSSVLTHYSYIFAMFFNPKQGLKTHTAHEACKNPLQPFKPLASPCVKLPCSPPPSLPSAAFSRVSSRSNQRPAAASSRGGAGETISPVSPPRSSIPPASKVLRLVASLVLHVCPSPRPVGLFDPSLNGLARMDVWGGFFWGLLMLLATPVCDDRRGLGFCLGISWARGGARVNFFLSCVWLE